MLRCCQAALVSPYQPSLEMLTRTSAPFELVLADLVGEDRLVADEDAVGVAAGGEDLAVAAGIEGADLVEEVLGEEEELLEGDVFAEGDEVHLVVAAGEGAVGGDEVGGVVEQVAAIFAGVGVVGADAVDADVADDDRRSGLSAPARRCASRNWGSLSWKGAGDSGQTIRSLCGVQVWVWSVPSGAAGVWSRIDLGRAGQLGDPGKEGGRGMAAEIGEGVEQFARGELRAGVGGAHLQIFLDQGCAWPWRGACGMRARSLRANHIETRREGLRRGSARGGCSGAPAG